MEVGLTQEARNTVAHDMTDVLADTYALYLKTHGYHWNVTGPHFGQLHLTFEQQYNDMWQAVDEIAERLRALGEVAPWGKDLTSRASIPEDEGVPDWQSMVKNLVAGHEQLIQRLRQAIPVAEENKDATSADVFTERLRIHEKTAWMLRSLIE